MKTLLLGIALIILVGIGGLIYRNALERPVTPANGACTLDAKICPDGSAVGRVAPDCNFAQCPPPNVTITSAGIVFALPSGYADASLPDASALAAYTTLTASSSAPDELVVREYAVGTSTPEEVIYSTAISDSSGAPVAPSTFSAATIGNHTYSFVVLGQFEGVVHTAYYLPVGANVLRFDAIDQNVPDWSDPNLDPTTLPANSALRTLLTTLQTNQ